MADECPAQYCDQSTLSLYRSKLQADLIGYLLEENRSLKTRVSSVEDRLLALESRLPQWHTLIILFFLSVSQERWLVTPSRKAKRKTRSMTFSSLKTVRKTKRSLLGHLVTKITRRIMTMKGRKGISNDTSKRNPTGETVCPISGNHHSWLVLSCGTNHLWCPLSEI